MTDFRDVVVQLEVMHCLARTRRTMTDRDRPGFAASARF
jgi:hypothetical protein